MLGKRIGERFLVETRAATGGMGVVYAGRDDATGAKVAIKVLQQRDPESLARFERESTVLADVAHPAIVGYVAHGVDGDSPYLVMDWIDGETLASRLHRAPLSVAESVAAIARVADALGHAHARGVIHRDVKPSNLMLPGRDLARIAVLDFGVARTDAGAGSLTETGAMLGTPSYMAPEQARGERHLDPAADVFSLGCVLYECLTGQRAFEGKHVLALLAKVAMWEPPRPRTLDPELAPALDDLIARMLAKTPDQRPRDGAAVAAALADMPRDPRPSTARKGRAKTPSTQVSVSQVASVVVAADPKSVDQVKLGAPTLTIAIPANVRVEQVRDGSIVAIAPGPAPALAAAREIRRARPDHVIVIVTGVVQRDKDLVTQAIDVLGERAVGSLAREAMALLFATAPRPAGAIRLDDRTAELLGPSVVTWVGKTPYAGAA